MAGLKELEDLIRLARTVAHDTNVPDYITFTAKLIEGGGQTTRVIWEAHVGGYGAQFKVTGTSGQTLEDVHNSLKDRLISLADEKLKKIAETRTKEEREIQHRLDAVLRS